MNHLIIVKFKDDVASPDAFLDDIEKIFEKSLEIEGIHSVGIHKNVTNRPNRYDLMIDINMETASLELFDVSDVHHVWKDRYTKYIQSKAIFDY